MSSGFSSEDLDSFFDTDGVAVKGVITGPAVTPPAEQFTKTINVIFSEASQELPLYGDTDVVASEPSFLCKGTDLAGGVDPGMTFTMPDLEAHEDGYGKTYKLTPRIVSEGGPQTSRVYLKEV
jgi:hypothetical protein